VACAAALAALNAFEHGGLIDRARTIEGIVTSRLRAAQQSDPRIGDVRGRGAMVALELVDPTTGDPDAALTTRVAHRTQGEGVIVLSCGTYGNVIRLLPPLTIPDDLLAEGLEVLLTALASS
jgi:4-aminobutyrate aminotransferase/(S)-3-amino-2-methylpropionate transaminase